MASQSRNAGTHPPSPRHVTHVSIGGLVALVVVAACSTSPPAGGVTSSSVAPGRTVGPREGGVASAVETYLSRVYSPSIANIRAVLVGVDGKTVVQRYRGTTPAATHDVHSVTKSVVATLIGIALSEGRLPSIDAPLATLLPEHSADMNPTVSAITLRQLLTMTAGLPADPADGDPDPILAGPDWVTRVLRRGTVAQPGSTFAYASAGSHLLSAILTRAVGASVLDYARKRLFDPLGIDTRTAAQPRLGVDGDAEAQYDRAAFAWPKDPTGVQVGFGTLKMLPTDLMKIGQLYLDGGRWKGRQIVPTTWVTQATTAQVTPEGPGFVYSEGYGYQWWVTTERGHPAYVAVGFGGQLVEVVRDLRLVVVTVTDTGDNNVRFEHLRGMVDDAIVPAVGG